jgi:hypothetical protein
VTGPPHDERRPRPESGVIVEVRTDDRVTIPPVAVEIRRRRLASWRCMPLEDGRRDPLDRPLPGLRHQGVVNTSVSPSCFGLTAAELVAEAARLRRLGWSHGEIRYRLDLRGAA